MSWLYRLGIGLYHSVIRLLAVFGNKKAKAWVAGRQLPIDWRRLDELRAKGPVIWMHVASLGEFEQGRPVLDLLRKELADELVIVLSFYSPSGYVPGQKYQGADLVTYLPADGKRRARQWLQQLQWLMLRLKVRLKKMEKRLKPFLLLQVLVKRLRT